MTLSIALLAFVTLQRVGELALAQRNTRRLLAEGAYETGQGHYPAIVLLHACWLVGLWCAAWDREVSLPWLAIYAALQLLRGWTLWSLGRRWTTRIIILPGASRVLAGPYRLISHPNYVIVAAEIAVLPLTFGLPAYAVVFSILNAIILRIRIGAENAALAAAGSAT